MQDLSSPTQMLMGQRQCGDAIEFKERFTGRSPLVGFVLARSRPRSRSIALTLARSLLLSFVARSLSLLEDYVYMSRKTPRWLAPCSLVLAFVLARSLSRSLVLFCFLSSLARSRS